MTYSNKYEGLSEHMKAWLSCLGFYLSVVKQVNLIQLVVCHFSFPRFFSFLCPYSEFIRFFFSFITSLSLILRAQNNTSSSFSILFSLSSNVTCCDDTRSLSLFSFPFVSLLFLFSNKTFLFYMLIFIDTSNRFHSFIFLFHLLFL